jgi:pimeloyl-ACP methyl ester carboxylesterase
MPIQSGSILDCSAPARELVRRSSRRPMWVSGSAVVSRGGRPDLAGAKLLRITVPTLFIVGGADHLVIELNEFALGQLRGPKALVIVPGATHLFPEPGALEAVIEHAAQWFETYLRGGMPHGARVT